METTESDVPVTPAGQPVRLSASGLDRLEQCPLRWFLEKKAAAEQAATAALGFGRVVHALAHDLVQAAKEGPVPGSQELLDRLDTVWHHLSFDAPWQSAQQREQAREALERLVRWHHADRDREVVGSEVPFDVTVEVGGPTVQLTGSADRVERDPDGGLHVVDLKTGKTAPGKAEVERHAQLGVYQLVAGEGGFGPGRPAGAELVQLRSDGPDGPLVQQQPALTDGWVADLLAGAALAVVEERFPPRVDDARCGRCPFATSCPAQAEGRQVVP